MASEVPNNIEATTSEASASHGHEITLYSEPIFHVRGLTITNSLLNSWLAVGVIILISLAIRLQLKTIPGKVQNFFELVLEQALEVADTVTGAREKTLTFMPLVFPLFIFIIINNWLGLIPGVGSIGFTEAGKFVPLFRGGTADLNTTLALSIVAVIFTHIVGVTMTTVRSHINRFVGFDLLLGLPREVFKHKNYQAILINPIKFVVSLLELVGEFAKVASLSFRLFGNIFAGEVLLGAMTAIFAYILPIPFIFMEVMVGLIQAVIFAMLVLVFLSIMSVDHNEAH